MACSRLCGSLKLGGCCLNLGLPIPSPVLSLLNQHPEKKKASCSLKRVNNFARNGEKLEIAVPPAWCVLPLPTLAGPLKVLCELHP